MKVLKVRSTKPWKKKSTCQECETVVELGMEDFTRFVNDFRDGDAAIYICPTCKHENWISTNLIPRHLRHQLPQ